LNSPIERRVGEETGSLLTMRRAPARRSTDWIETPAVDGEQDACSRQFSVCAAGTDGVAPGPGWRECTTYRQPGPGDTPLGLSLSKGLGRTRRPQNREMPCVSCIFGSCRPNTSAAMRLCVSWPGCCRRTGPGCPEADLWSGLDAANRRAPARRWTDWLEKPEDHEEPKSLPAPSCGLCAA